MDTVGFFVDSTDLWIAYLDFLRNQKTSNDSVGDYNLQCRKFYHRVVIIPLDCMDNDMNDEYRVGRSMDFLSCI